jgi:hypothetical protein
VIQIVGSVLLGGLEGASHLHLPSVTVQPPLTRSYTGCETHRSGEVHEDVDGASDREVAFDSDRTDGNRNEPWQRTPRESVLGPSLRYGRKGVRMVTILFRPLVSAGAHE